MTEYKIQLEDLPESIRDIAEAIGLGNTLTLVRLCGGQSPYIPKMETCEQAARYRVIHEEFKNSRSGRVYAELAKKYNYSESYIRDLIRKIERDKSLGGKDYLEQTEMF